MSTLAPDTTTCVKQDTTDLQLNANLAKLTSRIVDAVKTGVVVAGNSERLQGLTVDDIIDQVEAQITLPTVNNYITTDLVNQMDIVTDSYKVMDNKFVNTDFIPFQVIQKNINNVLEDYITFHLPEDLLNNERIVEIAITNKNETAHNNDILNETIYQYDIFQDPLDPRARYKVEIPAKKIILGELITYDVSNLPTEPLKWGTFGVERFIKATYLVPNNWFSTTGPYDNTLPVPDPNAIVSVQIESPIVPMIFGLNNDTNLGPVHNEGINADLSGNKIINEISSDIIPTRNYNIDTTGETLISLKSTDFNLEKSTRMINLLESYTTSSRIINNIDLRPEDEKIIRTLLDNLNVIPHIMVNPSITDLNETTNILVFPPNKMVSQVQNTPNLNLENYNDYTNEPARVVQEILATTINSRILSYIDKVGVAPNITTGDSTYSFLFKLNAGNGIQYPNFSVIKLTDSADIINQIILDILSLPQLEIQDRSNCSRRSERIINYKSCQEFLLRFSNFVENPSYVVNFIEANLDAFRERSNFDPKGTKIINFINTLIMNMNRHNNFINVKTELVGQIDLDNKFVNVIYDPITLLPNNVNIDTFEFRERSNFDPVGSCVILEDPIVSPAINYFNSLIDITPIRQAQANNIAEFKSDSIISQIGLIPATVVVSSGSLTYLKDLRNLQIVSSLNKIEYLPILTAEGKVQGNTYEIVAQNDQRVFEIETTGDIVVYREGFRLSKGDYYQTKNKVILKAGAKAGELIVIEEKKRFVFSNNVTKEELNNKLKELRADTPIISYINEAYEYQTVKIKIDNFQAHNVYTFVVRYDGVQRDDIPIIRNGDIVYLDLPEITDTNRKTISVIVYNSTEGRIQSAPAEANIVIRNLYDSTSDTKRLVFGTTPNEWFGSVVKNFKFIDKVSASSVTDGTSEFEIVPAETDIPERMRLQPEKSYVSDLVNVPSDFSGSTLDTKVTIENILTSPQIISTSLSESIIQLNGYTQAQIEEAHVNGSLYFILDSSESPRGAYDNPELLTSTYGKYRFQRSAELTKYINFLPRGSDSIFLEHTFGLKDRFIKAILIYNAEIMVDYDFDKFASVINGTVVAKTIPMENIEYQVQDGVPHLKISINDPTIPNTNNPYINTNSNFKLQLDSINLNKKIDAIVHPTDNYSNNGRRIDNSGFMVNNIYSERIFSGLLTDQLEHNQDVLNQFRKIYKFQLGNKFITPFKKDTYFLNEEDLDPLDVNGNKNVKIGLHRFRKPQEVHDNLVSFKSNVKLVHTTQSKDKAFKALINTAAQFFEAGSDYVSDFTLVQIGGNKTYTDALNNQHTVISSEISFEKIYIKDSFLIESGVVPDDATLVTDGYHKQVKVRQTLNIPTIWDTVYRPSTRTIKAPELKAVWGLIRDNISMSDYRWRKLNEGIIRKGQVQWELNNPGEFTHNDQMVMNIEDKPGCFILGGETYETTKTQEYGYVLTQDIITGMNLTTATKPADPDVNFIQRIYTLRGTDPHAAAYDSAGVLQTPAVEGYRNRDTIISIDYDWDNGEPCIYYRWARCREHYYSYDNGGGYYYQVMTLYKHKVSRKVISNIDIYYLDGTIINSYTTGTIGQLSDSILSGDSLVMQKIELASYQDIFKYPVTGTLQQPTDANKLLFQDMCYESNKYWFITRNQYSNNDKLWSLSFNVSSTNQMSAPFLEFHKEIIDPANTTSKIRWSLLKDVSGELRGDGPVMIRHNTNPKYLAGDTLPHDESFTGAGFYFYDNGFDNIEKKAKLNLPQTCTIFEIPGNQFMNPYYTILDGFVANEIQSASNLINKRMDLVGTRIFVISYLDRLIMTLTKEEFNLFKEEIVHLNNKTLSSNPDKLMMILPNHKYLEVKTIVPLDDYRSNSATVIYNRIVTETGRPAENITFKFTNYNSKPIDICNIRFSTNT